MKVCWKACLILLIVISSSTLHSQNITRSCGSDAIYLQQLQTNPAFLQTRNLISDHTHTYQSGQGMRRAEIHIPVVVHVVYNTELQNISDSQIIAQINILNKDFGTIQTQKYAQAAASSIRFHLATVDPMGYRTNGITRTYTTLSKFPIGPVVMSDLYGGKSPWPSQHYLNIWVANVSGVLGYAYMPGDSRDGVVINYKYFGPNEKYSPFDMGRTVTHEVGHWLNLFHTWGLSTGCEADDEVDDTPNSAEPNYGCKIDHPSCSGIDMVENFLDYSDDACMSLFTQGQVDRMEALFAPGGYRASILQSPGLSIGIIAHCSDGIQNGDETGIDCGGECGPCQAVALNTCNDGIQNGKETGIDCGGDCAPCPCIGAGMFSMFDYIQSVSINDSTHSTGDDHGYAAFDDTYLPLYTNKTNSIVLKPAPNDYQTQQHWSIWIDWNKNGLFDNDQEWVYHHQDIGTITDTLTLKYFPSTFKLATSDTFSMRVQMQWALPHSACDTFDFGETEDYKIILQEAILIDPCQNGIQDASETGIDCGPYCKPCQINYCISKGKISKYEFINQVSIGSQLFKTGNNNGYLDHTEATIEVNPGQLLDIHLQAGFAGNYTLSENWYMWADWNQDGDFDDLNEMLLQKTSALSIHENINIPAWVTPGSYRLRIQMRDSKKSNACETFSFGEVEDYTLSVNHINARVLPPKAPTTITVYPNPVSSWLNIRFGKLPSGKIKVYLINELGQVVYTGLAQITGENNITLDCQNVREGAFTLICRTENWQETKSILIFH